MNPDALAIELNDADLEVRLSAIQRLSANPDLPIPDATLDALLDCLGANRKIVQRRAAEALAAAASRDTNIVEKLRGALSRPEGRARWGAAYALGLITADGALDLRAMPALLEALSSDDGDIRWAAAELVVRLAATNRDAISDQLISLAREGNLNARKMALYCLRDVGGSREQLLAVAENCCEGRQSLLKMAALSLLTRLADSSDRASALAIRLLENDSDAGVRRCAAVALGHLGNNSTRVLDALKRAATNKDNVFLQRSATRALARLETRDDRPAQ
jgi:HEAT repeat protein